MKTINTKNAPEAVGAYSQGVLVNNTLYVSGQIPFDPKTMEVAGDNVQVQTKQCLDNVLAVVKAAGMDKQSIVRCSVFMTNLAEFTLMNDVYAEFFGNHKPARAAVEVRGLPKNVQIEIDAIAVKSTK